MRVTILIFLPPEIDVQSMTFREHEDAYEKNLLEK